MISDKVRNREVTFHLRLSSEENREYVHTGIKKLLPAGTPHTFSDWRNGPQFMLDVTIPQRYAVRMFDHLYQCLEFEYVGSIKTGHIVGSRFSQWGGEKDDTTE